MTTQVEAALAGLATLAVLWLIVSLALGIGWPIHAFDGADGRPSTSKFQFYVWTAVILWGYASVVAAHWITGADVGTIGIPTNLFILMGLGAATALGAKLATVGHGGRLPLLDDAQRTFRSLFSDDAGNPALEKIQILAWTAVAGVVFIGSVVRSLGSATAPTTLPNIDDALLVLLGIGQVTYVAVKTLPRSARCRGPGDRVAAVAGRSGPSAGSRRPGRGSGRRPGRGSGRRPGRGSGRRSGRRRGGRRRWAARGRGSSGAGHPQFTLGVRGSPTRARAPPASRGKARLSMPLVVGCLWP